MSFIPQGFAVITPRKPGLAGCEMRARDCWGDIRDDGGAMLCRTHRYID